MNFLNSRCTSISRSENKFGLSGNINDVVLASILITISVSTNDDGFLPSGYQSRNVGDNNWFSKNGTIQDISNSSIRGLPHLLQVEFLDSLFIRGNGCALDSDLALLDGLSGINGNLITSSVTVCYRKIKVLGVDVNIWVNVL